MHAHFNDRKSVLSSEILAKNNFRFRTGFSVHSTYLFKTQKLSSPFVWLHDNGIMNCGGGDKTSCQYWPLGASTTETVTALPSNFRAGGSVSLGNGAHWLGGGWMGAGGGTFENRHYLECPAVQLATTQLTQNFVENTK